VRRSSIARVVPLARTVPLERGKPLTARTGLSRGTGLPAVSARRAAAGGTVKSAATRSETGFSRSVKLKVRTRAGNGDPALALCEACGLWLGRRHGQVQHRVGRGAGGCKDEVINGPANAALLCGTPHTGCHGRATIFAADMGPEDKGFWIGRGTTPECDPRNVPIKLASEHGSGILVYLAADGLGPDGTGYLLEAPEVAAA
jgi:hypothetical protein